MSQRLGLVSSSEMEERRLISESYIGAKLCGTDDLVLNRLKAHLGVFARASQPGLVSPDYTVLRRATTLVSMPFLEYVLKSSPCRTELRTRTKGLVEGFWRLYTDDLYAIKLPAPPLPEQNAIVRFLDHADRRIRRHMQAKRKLITLLSEQKQGIIHRAVTRGLDANVRLKPSGVGWLGQVPEHWDVRMLGRVATSFRTGPFGSVLHQSDYVEGGTPLVNPTHMKGGRIVEDTRCSVSPAVVDRLSQYVLAKHDLIFSRRGELGRCALVREREAGWLCGTGSIRVRIAYDGIEPEYLIQALQVGWVGEYLALSSVGATMDSLNTGILKGIPILLPPADEQRQLLQSIAEASCTIERATSGAEREIEFLRECRTRLIADVVTGKLDVREAAGRLPDVSTEGKLEDEEPLPEDSDQADDTDFDAAKAEANS